MKGDILLTINMIIFYGLGWIVALSKETFLTINSQMQNVTLQKGTIQHNERLWRLRAIMIALLRYVLYAEQIFIEMIWNTQKCQSWIL